MTPPFVDAEHIRRQADGGGYERGVAYFRGGAVRSVTWDPAASVLESVVDGSGRDRLSMPHPPRPGASRPADRLDLLHLSGGARLQAHRGDAAREQSARGSPRRDRRRCRAAGRRGGRCSRRRARGSRPDDRPRARRRAASARAARRLVVGAGACRERDGAGSAPVRRGRARGAAAAGAQRAHATPGSRAPSRGRSVRRPATPTIPRRRAGSPSCTASRATCACSGRSRTPPSG